MISNSVIRICPGSHMVCAINGQYSALVFKDKTIALYSHHASDTICCFSVKCDVSHCIGKLCEKENCIVLCIGYDPGDGETAVILLHETDRSQVSFFGPTCRLSRRDLFCRLGSRISVLTNFPSLELLLCCDENGECALYQWTHSEVSPKFRLKFSLGSCVPISSALCDSSSNSSISVAENKGTEKLVLYIGTRCGLLYRCAIRNDINSSAENIQISKLQRFDSSIIGIFEVSPLKDWAISDVLPGQIELRMPNTVLVIVESSAVVTTLSIDGDVYTKSSVGCRLSHIMREEVQCVSMWRNRFLFILIGNTIYICDAKSTQDVVAVRNDALPSRVLSLGADVRACVILNEVIALVSRTDRLICCELGNESSDDTIEDLLLFFSDDPKQNLNFNASRDELKKHRALKYAQQDLNSVADATEQLKKDLDQLDVDLRRDIYLNKLLSAHGLEGIPGRGSLSVAIEKRLAEKAFIRLELTSSDIEFVGALHGRDAICSLYKKIITGDCCHSQNYSWTLSFDKQTETSTSIFRSVCVFSVEIFDVCPHILDLGVLIPTSLNKRIPHNVRSHFLEAAEEEQRPEDIMGWMLHLGSVDLGIEKILCAIELGSLLRWENEKRIIDAISSGKTSLGIDIPQSIAETVVAHVDEIQKQLTLQFGKDLPILNKSKSFTEKVESKHAYSTRVVVNNIFPVAQDSTFKNNSTSETCSRVEITTENSLLLQVSLSMSILQTMRDTLESELRQNKSESRSSTRVGSGTFASQDARGGGTISPCEDSLGITGNIYLTPELQQISSELSILLQELRTDDRISEEPLVGGIESKNTKNNNTVSNARVGRHDILSEYTLKILELYFKIRNLI